jgi:hypothetical protein
MEKLNEIDISNPEFSEKEMEIYHNIIKQKISSIPPLFSGRNEKFTTDESILKEYKIIAFDFIDVLKFKNSIKHVQSQEDIYGLLYIIMCIDVFGNKFSFNITYMGTQTTSGTNYLISNNLLFSSTLGLEKINYSDDESANLKLVELESSYSKVLTEKDLIIEEQNQIIKQLSEKLQKYNEIKNDFFEILNESLTLVENLTVKKIDEIK